MGTGTNIVDSDEMPHSVASHQGLHCFLYNKIWYNGLSNFNSLHAGYIFMLLLQSKKSFRNTIRVAKGLSPDQD